MIRTLRLPEVGLMLGFPGAAALLGLLSMDVSSFGRAAGSVGALAPVAVSVYALNAWGGAEADARDPKFARGAILEARTLLAVAAAGIVLGLVAAWLVAPWFAAGVAALWLVWAAYSAPHGLKGVPGAGTALHLPAGVLMFLLPYAVVRPVDERGLWLAALFSLAFAAGHANHEVMDRCADTAGGVRTLAAVAGARAVHRLGLVLATFAYLAAGLGWWRGVIAPVEAAPFLVAAPFHLAIGAAADADPEGASAYRYRARYRILFAAATVVATAGHLADLVLPG